MIEGFGEEMPEPEMREAIMDGPPTQPGDHRAAARAARRALGLPPYEPPESPPTRSREMIYERYGNELREAKKIHGKAERNSDARQGDLKDSRCRRRATAPGRSSRPGGYADRGAVKSAFHARRGAGRPRADPGRQAARRPRPAATCGRSTCEVGLLPRAHGSAIFQRGETQALVTTVLGTGADEQRVDGIMDEFSKKFMLDYNMPPFAVGEVRPIRGPGRREIGHGALAERSVAPILPDSSRFPYTIRVVSDILESNGSSSMASVCGAHPQPDGRRRADQRPGRRHLDRPGAGRGHRPPRPPDRHHRRRGPLRRHGLQGRRHPARA